jgi:GNAT superfamily N-acetyltransferase
LRKIGELSGETQAMVTIRPMEAHDLDAVVAACQWLFAAPASTPRLWDAAQCAARVSDLLAAESGQAYVADRDGVLVGFVTVYLDLMSIRVGQRAWVNELAVDPTSRSEGVGRRLLDTAFDWARERGATHVGLDASTKRVDAHRFYRRADPAWEAICFGWDLV